jgi:hypothetical protein
MQAKCVRTGGMNLTHCKVYVILDKASHGKVEVLDDSGSRVWVDADCFMF